VPFKSRTYAEALKKKQARDNKKKSRGTHKTSWATEAKKRKPLRTKSDPKLKAWSKAVRERDNFTCQVTGIRDVENNIAHHIAPRGRRPDLKYSIDNGVTITKETHYWIHFVDPIEATRRGLLNSDTYEKAMKGERHS
jgi:hypothetical protein